MISCSVTCRCLSEKPFPRLLWEVVLLFLDQSPAFEGLLIQHLLSAGKASSCKMPMRCDVLSLTSLPKCTKARNIFSTFWSLPVCPLMALMYYLSSSILLPFLKIPEFHEKIFQRNAWRITKKTHHANLFLASGSLLPLALNQPGLNLSKIQILLPKNKNKSKQTKIPPKHLETQKGCSDNCSLSCLCLSRPFARLLAQ